MIKALYQTFRGRAGLLKNQFLREARARAGSFREQEGLGLLSRPSYAYGMLRAADVARYVGLSRVTVCEFGVALGWGLRAMIDLGDRISKETGVSFRIVGFDTGGGLPEIDGYRDHPEIWSSGDFAMVNRDELVRSVEGRAELIFGDIKDTVDGFVAGLSPEAPLGFVSVDVDIYSGARSALRCLDGGASLHLPAVSMYFDDVSFFFANRWCGELLAIEEFNAEHPLRKIDVDRGLIRRRAEDPKFWYNHMYVAHVLDHERRAKPMKREGAGLAEHQEFVRRFNLD